ncbi:MULTISPECIES: SGNH/GDSL hydrolase family protein [Actinosynnema]|uniref:SGNH/GDSL hydrolase family protein n=1 Tax=Actinosynnema TaxID=40566 RepID=UPI0020A3CB9A|nr:SGNH/GDSL hydrolase family protein [Actinosynnema pretiosum]MCP2098727.1 Lysophospholipase L1 [Actinosynnema pretiosum]
MVWSPRKALLALVVVLAGTLLVAPGAGAAESNGGTRVMPLGDSITDGWNVPGGYRVGLWRRLVAEGYAVDFVGSGSNGPSELGDHDHEGHPGWRIDELHARIQGWLRATTPRVVLLHIGTNDIGQDYDVPNAPARLGALLDRIQLTAPAAWVFVAKITPIEDPVLEARVLAFNNALPGIVADRRRVHLVDMHDGFVPGDLADGVHPSTAGYDKMAARWRAALATVPESLPKPPVSTG